MKTVIFVASFGELRDASIMELTVEIPDDLAAALGGRVTSFEEKLWAALKPEDRAVALQRAIAFTRWHDARGSWTAKEAAAAAGITVNRFYALAAKWEYEGNRSLANLGVGAEAPRRRRSAFDPALLKQLTAHAKALVSAEGADERSISALAAELEATIPENADKKPRTAFLRSMLVEARRLHAMNDVIGTDLAFDLCACQLADMKGQPHILFVCIDRGTGFVLSFGFGKTAESLKRHQALASNILDTFGSSGTIELPWSASTDRVEMVVGTDRIEFQSWAEAKRAELAGAGKVNLQPSIKPRRFGRYLREHFGAAVGRIKLLPGSTRDPSEATSVSALSKERYTVEDALVRVGLEVADHNEAVLARLRKPIPMPDQTKALLQRLAAH